MRFRMTFSFDLEAEDRERAEALSHRVAVRVDDAVRTTRGVSSAGSLTKIELAIQDEPWPAYRSEGDRRGTEGPPQ